MATEEILQKIGSEVAAADLSTHQYKCVLFDASGVALCSVAGSRVDGILQDAPVAGQSANVAIGGRSKAVAGAAIAKGSQVSTDANGKLKVAASGEYILGVTAEAAAADGEIVSVIMTRPGRVA